MAHKLKDEVKLKLISDYGSLLKKERVETTELEAVISYILNEITQRSHLTLTEEEKKQITSDVIDDLMGFGPAEILLKDPQVTEVMINGPKKIYVERNGKKELSPVTFESEKELLYHIHRLLEPTRRHVDESYPYTDVSFKNGLRVNIVIQPVALDGTLVTMRKYSRNIQTVEDIVKLGSMDQRISDFLVACIKAKANIIFSGATGSGKTTLLNALSSHIPGDERIITIEDAAELRLNQEHVARLETRSANLEGKGEISIRDLFKNSLRMRPDRIILGEIRGAEALDMLQSMCSGHSGSLAVLHAQSPQDAIYRLETLILASGVPISVTAIHRQMAAAIHIIVQLEQLADGSRKVTHITQIESLHNEEPVLQDLFYYEMSDFNPEGKIAGKWHATGVTPSFGSLFKKENIEFPANFFAKD